MDTLGFIKPQVSELLLVIIIDCRRIPTLFGILQLLGVGSVDTGVTTQTVSDDVCCV